MAESESTTPGQGIDTGTGGFKAEGVDGVGDKSLTYDPGAPDGGTLPTWSPGQINVDKTVKDLAPGTKKTLGAYLSKTTLGQTPSSGGQRPNPYPVLHDAVETPVPGVLKDSLGYAASLTAYNVGNSQPHFANIVPGDSRTLTVDLTRGLQQPPSSSALSGHALLKDLVAGTFSNPSPRGSVNSGDVKEGPVKTYTTAVLQAPGQSTGVLTVEQLFSAAANLRVASLPVPATLDAAAAHLSNVTKGSLDSSPSGADNAYPIDATGGTVVSKFITPLGYVAPLSVPSDSQKKFAGVTTGRSNLSDALDLLRGRQDPVVGALDGNELLKDLVTGAFTDPAPRGDVNLGSLNSGPVNSYTVTVLQAPGQNPGVLTVEQLFSVAANTRMPSVEVPPTLAGKANYLSRATKGQLDSSPTSVGNTYPVDNSASVAPTDLRLTTDGYPSPLSTGQQKFSEIPTGRSNDSKDLNILRGREKPQPSGDPKIDKTQDGNKLLRGASERRGTVQNPPPPGEVNIASLSAKSPVKYYTEDLVKKNKNTTDATFTAPQNSPALRPAGQLETTTYNGLTPQDLPEKKRETLGKYLGTMTRDGITSPNLRGNSYPVDADAIQPETLQKDGYAQDPHASPNGSKFVEDKVLSSRSQAATNIKDYGLSRTPAAASTNTDGHVLLKEATPELRSGGVAVNPSSYEGKLPELNSRTGGISSVIKSYYGPDEFSKSVIYNRFNPSAYFSAEDSKITATSTETIGQSIADNSGAPKLYRNKLFASKYRLGSYQTADGKERNVSFGKLAQVGNALSIRASTELGAFDRGNNPTNNDANAGAILPGLAQLGVTKVDQNLLEAKDILEALPESFNEELIINPMAQSWGTLNNVQDQFAGISAFGMQLLAIALLVALAVVISLFSLLLLIPSSLLLDQAVDHMGRRPYGLFRMAGGNVDYSSVAGILEGILSGQFSLWRLFGVASTLNNPAEALPIGALAFFGVPVSTTDSTAFNIIEAAGKAILEVTQNPGYYAVMTRTFTRSFVLIIEAFKDIGRAFSAGISAGIGAILGIVGVIRESKFMKGVSIFIQLGDRVLSSKTDEKVDVDYSQGASRRIKSEIDDNPNGEAVTRSRLDVPDKMKVSPLTLAWASYRAPDLLILPSNMATFLSVQSNSNPISAPPS